MDCYTLIILASVTMVASGWSFPFYPVYRHRVPRLRVTRFAPIPRPHRLPIRPEPYIKQQIKPKPERPNDDYDYYDDEDDHNQKNDNNHKNNHKGSDEVIGPVRSFVKTDKNANFKWGVRHHVGKTHAS